MKAQREPEIISPDEPFVMRGRSFAGPSDDLLERIVSLLDDGFRLPVVGLRFGIDPLLGLLPGLGDALAAIGSFLVIYAGWRRGLPRVTLVRMLANIAIDSVGGALPVVGDAFDFYWKSNRMNFNLLQGRAERRRQSWRDWLFLGILGMILLGLALLPLAVLVVLVRWLWR
ncbi:MAG TPA: DUF4112 domain-containing protein [Terriglobales bacterium]|nr:DUF4112 domain-containing protein [Terriglobales bacterium]